MQPIVLTVEISTIFLRLWIGGKLATYPAVGPDRVLVDHLYSGFPAGLGWVSDRMQTLPPLSLSPHTAACTTSL